VHEACLEVGVAFATPTLGALVSPVTAQRPRPRIGSNHLAAGTPELDDAAENVDNPRSALMRGVRNEGVPGAGSLESQLANDHARAVDDTPALSARRDMFLDERGTALRVTWHPERDLVVLSVWQGNRCVGTFRMPVQDVPRLSGLLAAALGDWVDQADSAATQPPEGGGRGDLSVQQRLRLTRPVLRLRGLQHRRRRPPPVRPA
jgi:hypothetical protein